MQTTLLALHENENETYFLFLTHLIHYDTAANVERSCIFSPLQSYPSK